MKVLFKVLFVVVTFMLMLDTFAASPASDSQSKYFARQDHKLLVKHVMMKFYPANDVTIDSIADLRKRVNSQAALEAITVKKNPQTQLLFSIEHFDFKNKSDELIGILGDFFDKIPGKNIHFVDVSDNNLGEGASRVLQYINKRLVSNTGSSVMMRKNNIKNLHVHAQSAGYPVMLYIDFNPQLSAQAVHSILSSGVNMLTITIANDEQAQALIDYLPESKLVTLQLRVSSNMSDRNISRIFKAVSQSKLEALELVFVGPNQVLLNKLQKNGRTFSEQLVPKVNEMLKRNKGLRVFGLINARFESKYAFKSLIECIKKAGLWYVDLSHTSIAGQSGVDVMLFDGLSEYESIQGFTLNHINFSGSLTNLLANIIHPNMKVLINMLSTFNGKALLNEKDEKSVKHYFKEGNISGLLLGGQGSKKRIIDNEIQNKHFTFFYDGPNSLSLYLARHGSINASSDAKTQNFHTAQDILTSHYTVGGLAYFLQAYPDSVALSPVAMTVLVNKKDGGINRALLNSAIDQVHENVGEMRLAGFDKKQFILRAVSVDESTWSKIYNFSLQNNMDIRMNNSTVRIN